MDYIYEYDIDPVLPAPVTPDLESGNTSFNFTEDFAKKLSNKFSLLTSKPIEASQDDDDSTKLAQQFAKISIDLLKTTKSESSELSVGNKPVHAVSAKLAQILDPASSHYLEDNSLKTSLRLLENDNVKKEFQNGMLVQPGLVGTVSRTKLSLMINGKALKESQQILNKFKPVYESIDKLKLEIDNLTQINQSIAKEFAELSAINDRSFKSDKFNLQQLHKLKSEKDCILIKKHLLRSFQQKYQLNEYEKYLLESSAEITNNSSDFFHAFVKAQQIYSHCTVLLSVSATTGAQVMDSTKMYIDAGLHNMTFHIKQSLDSLDQLDKKELTTLKYCIYLSVNADNFESSLIVEPRAKAVLKSFDADNTFASVNSPVRYIGDLLASVHSLIVSEKESLEILLGGEEKDEFRVENHEKISELQQQVLDEVISSLSVPFKSRIEQVIRSQNDVSVLALLYDSLDLYSVMFAKQLLQTNLLLENIAGLKSLLQQRVFTVLHSKHHMISSVMGKLDESDLQPPEWLIDYMSSVHGILKALSSGSFMGFSSENESLDQLVGSMIDKPLEFVGSQIESSAKLADNAAKIVQVNCLDLILSKTSAISVLEYKNREMSSQIEALESQLVDISYNALLSQTQLATIESEMDKQYPLSKFTADLNLPNPDVTYDVYVSVTSSNSFQLPELKNANAAIEQVIPDIMTLRDFVLLDQISSPTISNRVVNNTMLRFVEFYRIFHTVVTVYVQEKVLTWNDNEISALLGVSY